MGRPLKLKFNGSTFAGLQEMSDADLDTVAHMILEEFGSTIGVGNLYVNGNTANAHIGTWVDTKRVNTVGSHPVGTSTNSTSYVFRQDLGSVTHALSSRPFDIKSASPFTGLQEMGDSEIVTDIINRVKAKVGSNTIGTYVLQPNAPGTGTWLNKGTITNDTQTGSNTSTLWLCSAYGTNNVTRPLEWSAGIKEMSDSMIKELVSYYRSEIATTGIGNYYLGPSPPAAGTWITAGSGFDDTRHQLGNVAYTGGYTGGYILYYSGRNAGTYYGTYYGNYTGQTVLSAKETVTTFKLWLRTA